MRIGVVPGSASKGGVYQYSLMVLDALDPGSAAAHGDEFVVFGDDAEELAALERAGWQVAAGRPPSEAAAAAPSSHNAARRLASRLRGVARTTLHRPAPAERAPHPDDVQRRPDLAAWHEQLGIDLVIYPNPTTLSFEIGTPYVTAVHDLQHRLQPEFPEVSANGEAEWREYLYRNAIRRATLVVVDSEVGKEDVLRFYGEFGVTGDRVKVLPFAPPPYLVAAGRPSAGEIAAVRARHGLPERYFFYPAQLWPHKNHVRLVQALGRLRRDHGVDAPIAFSGSSSGGIRGETYQRLARAADDAGVTDLVHRLGHVANDEMAPLYAGAVALTMPTFFGPTNIPVLEAWATGCPVLTSDIRGVREQADDAAVLVDPRSVDAIADGMLRLWTDDALRRRLVDRGAAQLSRYGADRFRDRLWEIIAEAKERVREEAA